MKSVNARTLAYGGLLAAIIAALTAYVRIALPTGYLNPGDIAVALAGAVLGPIAATPAAIGSAMADLLGYAIYAPFTFVIKGYAGLAAGMAYSRRGARSAFWLLTGALAIVGGYFFTDLALSGAGAFASIWGNAVQAALYAVSALFFRKIKIAKLLRL